MSDSGAPQIPPERVALPTHFFTHDQERIEHIISDETLMQVARGGQDNSLQITMAAFGVAAGYVQNLVNVLGKMEAGVAVGRWDAFGALIFIVAATTGVITLVSYRRTSTDVTDLIAKIRNRKIGVMVEPGKPYVGGQPVPGDPSIAPAAASTTE